MKTPRSPEHNKHFLYFCCLRHIGHVASARADKQHLVGVRRRRKFLYENGNAPLLPSYEFCFLWKQRGPCLCAGILHSTPKFIFMPRFGKALRAEGGSETPTSTHRHVLQQTPPHRACSLL